MQKLRLLLISCFALLTGFALTGFLTLLFPLSPDHFTLNVLLWTALIAVLSLAAFFITTVRINGRSALQLFLLALISLLTAAAITWAQTVTETNTRKLSVSIASSPNTPNRPLVVYGISSDKQKLIAPDKFSFRPGTWQLTPQSLNNPGNSAPAVWTGELPAGPLFLVFHSGPQAGTATFFLNGSRFDLDLNRKDISAVIFDISPHTIPKITLQYVTLSIISIGAMIFLLLLCLLPDRLSRPRSGAAWRDFMAIAFFLLIIALPLLAALFLPADLRGHGTEDSDMRRHNRLSLASPDAMPNIISNWFSDRMPLRRYLLSSLANLNYLLFNDTLDPRSVIIGRNGVFYLGDTGDIIKSTNLVRPDRFPPLLRAFSAVRDQLARQHCRFYIMIAPDKHMIYPEYLPPPLAAIPQNHPAAELAAELRNRDFNVVWTPPLLLDKKKECGDRLFNKTDSHWSLIGAYYAYAELLKLISRDFPAVKALTLDQAGIVPPERPYNLQQMSGITLDLHDFDVALPAFASPLQAAALTATAASPARGNFRVRYNHNLLVTNPALAGRPRVLIVKDSFSEALSPFLNHTFSQIVYVNFILCSRDYFDRIVQQFKPDIVIFEMVERNLFSNFWLRWDQQTPPPAKP